MFFYGKEEEKRKIVEKHDSRVDGGKQKVTKRLKHLVIIKKKKRKKVNG